MTAQLLRSWVVHALPVWGAVTLTLLSGALLAVMPGAGAVLLLSGILFLGFLLLPWSVLLWGMLATAGFLVGPLQYAAGVSKAFWLPYLLAVLMGLRVLVNGLDHEPARLRDRSSEVPGLSAAEAWMRTGGAALVGLAVVALAASAVHQIGWMQMLIGGKEYLFLWSLPLAFAFGLLRLAHLQGLWKACALWLAVQLVVVVWQRFVVAPRRGGDAPWDSVVGLFAGTAFGAGGSGSMALVSLWAAASVVMAWRGGLVSGRWALLGLASALGACALAEVKVAVLLLPVLAIAVLAGTDQPLTVMQQRHTRPMRGGGVGRGLGILAALGVAALLMWAHQHQFSAQGSHESRSTLDYLQTTLDRNLDMQATPDEHGQLSRLGALQYWWRRQSLSDVPGFLIGHGVGSVRRSHVSPGKLVQGLRFEPARSSMAVLLWETGLLGLLAWVGAFACWIGAAFALRRQSDCAAQRVSLRSAMVIMALAVFSLPYGADWFEAPHLAVATLLGVGIVWGAHRDARSVRPDGTTNRAPQGLA